MALGDFVLVPCSADLGQHSISQSLLSCLAPVHSVTSFQSHGMDTEIESAQKVDPGEANSPNVPVGTQTRDFLIASLVL